MKVFESIHLFFGGVYKATPVADSTVYKITTHPHEYVGTIIYQDATVIKFKREYEIRLVKILKSNITSISILR